MFTLQANMETNTLQDNFFDIFLFTESATSL